MADLPKMSYEELVAECKRLRTEAERSLAQFYAFLVVVERSYDSVWRGAGHTRYESFVKQVLTYPHLYVEFRDGLDKVGVDAAIENGAHWTIEIGKIRNTTPAMIEEMASKALHFREVNEKPPSAQTAHQWASSLGAQFATNGGADARASKLRKLEIENRELRQKLRKVEAERDALRAELAKSTSKTVKKSKAA